MAKLSAYGDEPIKKVELGKRVVVLTKRGRVLEKIKGIDSGYRLVTRGPISIEQFDRWVEKLKNI